MLRVRRIGIPKTLPVTKVSGEESDGQDSDGDDEDDVELADEGARLLQFAPDGRRLLIITPDSKILMANIDITVPGGRAVGKERPAVTISSPIYHLDRELAPPQQPSTDWPAPSSKRKSRQKQDEGCHGAYLNTIVKASFSSTSRLLAVGDLAGNITTFALSPLEDCEWTRITTAIPRLPAAPVVLSFRPAPSTLQISFGYDGKGKSEDEGEEEAPDAELLVLPADTHSIHLFSATSGRLTPWSQQHPMPDCLPVEFAVAGDRAVGAFWEGTERVWCYSASWVWMFDFSRVWSNHKISFDVAAGNGNSNKRKRDAPVNVGSISGAGARMAVPMGLGKHVPKMTAGEGKEAGEGDAVTEDETDDDNDGDGDDDDNGDNGGDDDDDDGAAAAGARAAQLAIPRRPRLGKKGQKPYWGSYRYRSLLGLLPVGKPDIVQMTGNGWEGDGLSAMEMVVVERPAWDVGLPPRFYDGRDR